MSTETSYLAELEELLKSTRAEDLADVLGVTVRSIQNYTTEGNRTKPHPKTIQLIHETYTKLRKGEGLKAKLAEPEPAKTELLEQAIYNMSKAQIINAEAELLREKNMERVTKLLERKWDMVGMELPDPGTEGTVTMKPNKKAAH